MPVITSTANYHTRTLYIVPVVNLLASLFLSTSYIPKLTDHPKIKMCTKTNKYKSYENCGHNCL